MTALNTQHPQFTFLSGMRNGKYEVRLCFPLVNAFGGYEHDRSFIKLYSPEECCVALAENHYEFHNIPAELA